jgi:hypothetical protein
MFFKNIKNIDSNINLSNVAQIPTRVNLNQNNKNVNSIWKNSENP